MKRITFLLPWANNKPVGGYKVIYEYANKFIEDNYEVNLIFPATIFWKQKGVKEKLKGIVRYVYFKIKSNNYLPNSWFKLNNKIKIYWVPSLEEKYIPDADYIFATGCQTAEYVNNCAPRKGKKLYLIQSYENWCMNENKLIETWKFPMKKIVISKYLEEMGKKLNEETYYVENGLNFTNFYPQKEIIKEEETIMMLYHRDEKVKQSKKALKLLLELKNKRENMKIILFGVNPKENQIPDWIEYYQLPSIKKLNELYNRATIFVSPSKIEGWALPPAEAMQCKTCVCVTKIPGHEYVKHLFTGYCISDNLDNLKEVIEVLLENKDERKKMEINGYEYIQKFTWDKSYLKVKRILENY